MPRKKIKDKEQLLSHPIILRVTAGEYARLEKLASGSDCSSIGEVVRRIISNRQVVMRHKDVSMDGTMEQLALIRKELRSIGVNINQITRSFNKDKAELQRSYYVLQVAELYKKVDARMEVLLKLIAGLAEKWLQG
ncbi:MAG: plasmid mobilization relaxosome protein MobC [Chitinophagaceae bacterium]|nr:MAG: plasmid mobilization relaxosome protein MobC [Chitinophagaceae bacterium]